MNLLLRLLWLVGWHSRRQERLGPLEESSLRLRVLPNDLDANLHMNNGRYLSVMDLGRIDLLVRTGLAQIAWQRRWMPLVGAATIRYRRPLNVFNLYTLRTRIAHWDHKWFYVWQQFERDGDIVATARLKGLLREGRRTVSPVEALETMGHETITAPTLADDILWQSLVEPTTQTTDYPSNPTDS